MVYNPPKLIEDKEAQFENILNVLVISSELNLDKSIIFKDEQELNISAALCTFVPTNLDMSAFSKFVHSFKKIVEIGNFTCVEILEI